MWRIAFLIVLGTVVGAPTQEMKEVFIPGYGPVVYSENQGNMNDYLDRVIAEATAKFPELNIDPMAIPSFEHHVQKEIWFVTLYGGVKVNSGTVKGLKSIRRAGDATLEIHEGTNIMNLDGSLSVNNIHINANALAWFSFVNINLNVAATASYLRASIKVQLPIDGQQFKPRATYFVVNDLSGFNIKVSNLGPLNWLAENIISWYMGDVKTFINQRFASMALDAINSQIGKVLGPF